MKCPNCRSLTLRKINTNQYFCANCCIELTLSKKNVSIYQVEEDGTLSSLNDLFDISVNQLHG